MTEITTREIRHTQGEADEDLEVESGAPNGVRVIRRDHNEAEQVYVKRPVSYIWTRESDEFGYEEGNLHATPEEALVDWERVASTGIEDSTVI